MITRDQLRQVIDTVPEGQLDEVAAAIEPLIDPVSWALLTAPDDDEPETQSEQAAVAEARAAYRRGEIVSHADVRREFGA